MPKLLGQLEIDRCPHCQVDSPMVQAQHFFITARHDGKNKRFWGIYSCSRCGDAVLAWSREENGDILEMYPTTFGVDDSIPEPAKNYLKQALSSLHAPAGSVMLRASSVDAMLKAKGYNEGSLYTRINASKEDNLITDGMADWAHEVRLDANDPRHADTENPLSSEADAQKCVDFTQALG